MTVKEQLAQFSTKGEKIGFLEGMVGSLSTPGKMPCYSYSIPARECKTGSRLARVEGSVCYGCYALDRGNYRFGNVKGAMEYRYKATTENSRWAEYMTELIRLKEKTKYFRWHDSGDIQSLKHLEDIAQIAKNLPDISFWLPTRENSMVKAYTDKHGEFPDNLTVRISAHMVNSLKSNSTFPLRSAVVLDEEFVEEGVVCPATKKEGNRKCNECRMCWDKSVPVINYLFH